MGRKCLYLASAKDIVRRNFEQYWLRLFISLLRPRFRTYRRSFQLQNAEAGLNPPPSSKSPRGVASLPLLPCQGGLLRRRDLALATPSSPRLRGPGALSASGIQSSTRGRGESECIPHQGRHGPKAPQKGVSHSPNPPPPHCCAPQEAVSGCVV